MQRVIKQSRALLLLLAFVLVFAPVSTLAGSGEKQPVTYVSLGDSLAAGLLSDGKTIGTGYAGNIKNDLESKGYEVSFENYGVPGFTSQHVLLGLPGVTELAEADIITISAGANDVLAGLDAAYLDYLIPGKVETLVQAAEEAVEAAGIASTTAVNTINEATEPVNEAMDTVQDAQTAAVELKDAINPNLGALPTEILTLLDTIYEDVAVAYQSVTDADNDLMNSKKTFATDPSVASSALDTLYRDLGLSEQKLKTAEMKLGILEALMEEYAAHDDLKALGQLYKTKVTNAMEKVNSATVVIKSAEEAVNAAIDTQIIAHLAVEKAEFAAAKAVELSQMIAAIPGKIKAVGVNMTKIIGEIKAVNPDAEIYVMGYYNALPYLSPEVQSNMTLGFLKGLNGVLQGAAASTGATFISTFELFEGNYNDYLPNPTNIHPSDAGYGALANGFMSEIGKSYPEIVGPTELNIDLGKKVNVSKDQLLIINGTTVSLKLPGDLPEGTTLIVTATNKDIIPSIEDLTSAGDALNFEFQFPESEGNYEGKYELVMGYDSTSPGDVGIYYYNDEGKGAWVIQEGKVDKESNSISSTVTHFSNYGVFAKAEVKEDPPEVKEPEDKTPPVVKDPKDPPKGVDKFDGSSKTPTKTTGGAKLPKTATNTFNMMLIGTIFLASGLSSLVIMRKRRVIPNKIKNK